MGRAGARTLDQDSSTSPNLEALLSISNMNTNKFSSALGNQNNRNMESSSNNDIGQNIRSSNSSQTQVQGQVQGQGQLNPNSRSGLAGVVSPSTFPSDSTSDPSSSSLNLAAKRANLMHNMRRIERIELLTHKRKDR